ncbi:neuronal growth regulator 1-like [Watersipora subatra]|uniref:neuronal growth regulator 1-like n=1 Tax=Watersipora subatra TaxID=2589382 RepID=UPI00355BD69D
MLKMVILPIVLLYISIRVSEGVSELNVTALKGQTAQLPCSIDSQEPDLRVIWMDKMSNVLYYNEQRMIDDTRFTVSVFDRNWNLNIINVDSSDEGEYQCIISTNPMQFHYYWLTIFVPPKIVVESSSPDVEAPEGTTVRLACNATGYPEPTISWSYRRASEPANSTHVKKIQQTGPVLQIHNVTRYLDEIYTCSANNGYEVPDKHDIRVRVSFKPQIITWQRKVLAGHGETVSLKCEGIGYRQPRVYFAKDKLELRPDDEKYIYTFNASGYSNQLTLTIVNLELSDFGYYRCVAINALGKAEKYIELKAKAELSDQPEQETSHSETSPSTTRRTRKLQDLPPELKNIAGQQPVSKGSTSQGTALSCSIHTFYILLCCLTFSSYVFGFNF